jgi:ubiquinone/menaquinone biosynthesis C-methylase UbiE
MERSHWQWNEMIQVGTDYLSEHEVRAYDDRMAAIRDVGAEARRILGLLGLTADDSLLEIGTGTGAFARAASRHCRTVIAIDVSETMLGHAARRAREDGISNIEYVHAGFLGYEHQGDPLAAVVSQLALHHLPDAWKLVALKRLAGAVRTGGGLYLTDVVFPDEAQLDFPAYADRLLGRMPADVRDEMAVHIRQEYSTFDWIMQGILRRAGFAVESAEMEGEFLAHYLCCRV